MADVKEVEARLKEVLGNKVKKYGDDAKKIRAVVSTIGTIIHEQKQQGKGVDIEPSESAISVEQVVDMAIREVDELTAPTQPATPQPPPEPKPTPAEPKPEPKPTEPDGEFLPSGAKVPTDVPRDEIQTIKVTSPLTLESSRDVVELRRRLKMKQQTSQHKNVADEAVNKLMDELAQERAEQAQRAR